MTRTAYGCIYGYLYFMLNEWKTTVAEPEVAHTINLPEAWASGIWKWSCRGKVHDGVMVPENFELNHELNLKYNTDLKNILEGLKKFYQQELETIYQSQIHLWEKLVNSDNDIFGHKFDLFYQ